jgi:hypothetical protein
MILDSCKLATRLENISAALFRGSSLNTNTLFFLPVVRILVSQLRIIYGTKYSLESKVVNDNYNCILQIPIADK